MRSVAVVLPASIWAMMPMLRVLSSGIWRGMGRLPAVVGEGLVGFRHTMRVFALLDGCAAVVGGVVELAGKALDHRLLGSAAGVQDDPAHAERYTPRRADLDGHLIGGAADAPRAHFDDRLHVVERALEDA